MTTLEVLQKSGGALMVDTIMARTGRTVGQTNADLTLLEINGQVRSVGGRYEYVPPSKSKAPARAKKRKAPGKPVKSSGKTVSVEKCGCRTLHRDSGSGRFVKGRK